jgi:hypothetical protein
MNVPVTSEAESRIPSQSAVRVKFIPDISSHVDETLGCVSWISLSVENTAVVTIPPLTMARDMTLIYWRASAKAFSGQTGHADRVAEVLKRLVVKFGEQYKAAQNK